jgi:hypothetical protein
LFALIASEFLLRNRVRILRPALREAQQSQSAGEA